MIVCKHYLDLYCDDPQKAEFIYTGFKNYAVKKSSNKNTQALIIFEECRNFAQGKKVIKVTIPSMLNKQYLPTYHSMLTLMSEELKVMYFVLLLSPTDYNSKLKTAVDLSFLLGLTPKEYDNRLTELYEFLATYDNLGFRLS